MRNPQILIACAVASLLLACGDDSTKSDNNGVVGTDAGSTTASTDAGEGDASSQADASAVDCLDDEHELDGTCVPGFLSISLLAMDQYRSVSTYVSWVADSGPATESVQVTETCAFSEELGSGPEPTAPDCLDAGTLSITVGETTLEFEQGENCYNERFDMSHDWAGETAEVAISGGADLSATTAQLELSPAAEVEPSYPNDGSAILTRTSPDRPTGTIVLLPSASVEDPVLLCEETSSGEFALSAEDISAIRALDGDYGDAVVLQGSATLTSAGDNGLSLSTQNTVVVPDFLPAE